MYLIINRLDGIDHNLWYEQDDEVVASTSSTTPMKSTPTIDATTSKLASPPTDATAICDSSADDTGW